MCGDIDGTCSHEHEIGFQSAWKGPGTNARMRFGFGWMEDEEGVHGEGEQVRADRSRLV